MKSISNHDDDVHIVKDRRWDILFVPAAILLCFCSPLPRVQAQNGPAQATSSETSEQKVDSLTKAMAQAQSQMETVQTQLAELRAQLAALQQQIATEKANAPAATQHAAASGDTTESTSGPAAALDEIRERQAIEESQIATHDVAKVETDSKYPLKVSGLLLLNGFVNTRQVDVAAAPTYALPGSGSTGLSIRQTVLGLDARGPRLADAASRADLRVDFFAGETSADYPGGGVLRLRTAHAALDWKNTEAFFELDRSLLEPNEPSSLVAIAQPELAWAGNLWNWNPQAGISHHFALSDSARMKIETAFIDASDPIPPGLTASAPSVTQTERSRWPGVEARIAFQHGESGIGTEVGVGGYFSPHRAGDGNTFNAWAGTVDLKMPLSRYFELTVNGYRGQALAGLGGGGYVNYYDLYEGSEEYAHGLDDAGGWAQLKARPATRLEINAGFGVDNPFAKEIQAAMASAGSSNYPGLARNRGVYSNAIYSPSAYLLFSVEYRRLWTNYSSGPTDFTDVIGIGAGYRF